MKNTSIDLLEFMLHNGGFNKEAYEAMMTDLAVKIEMAETNNAGQLVDGQHEFSQERLNWIAYLKAARRIVEAAYVAGAAEETFTVFNLKRGHTFYNPKNKRLVACGFIRGRATKGAAQ